MARLSPSNTRLFQPDFFPELAIVFQGGLKSQL
jgi:hypothetical protein